MISGFQKCNNKLFFPSENENLGIFTLLISMCTNSKDSSQSNNFIMIDAIIEKQRPEIDSFNVALKIIDAIFGKL